MGKFTDWITSLLSKSSPGSASERQSKAEQGDAEAQHKLGLSNADSLEIERIVADFYSFLFSISSPGSASERQSKAEQGDAEAQHKPGLSNVDSLEPDGDGIYDLREKENSGLAPVVMLVNYILAEAIKRGASEIHIDSNEDNFWFSYRIDGILNFIMSPPKRLQNAVINRVKIMAKLEIWKKQLPHDGKIGVRVDGRAHDLRVSTLPDRYGEKVVIQIPDSAKVQAEGHNQ